jgi:hypothetical protein
MTGFLTTLAAILAAKPAVAADAREQIPVCVAAEHVDEIRPAIETP